MERAYTWYMGWAVVVGSVTAAIVGAGALFAWHTAPAIRFAQAEAYWRTRPIPHYRLVIERPSLHCQQDVEVIDEQIVQIYEDTCPIELLTMTELFERIARLDGDEPFGMFATEACGCAPTLNAYVTYDTRLSYPREIGIADQRRVDWLAPDCWQYILVNGGLPECDFPLLSGPPRITNVVLTPLP